MKFEDIEVGKFYRWMGDGEEAGLCLKKNALGFTVTSWRGGIHWLNRNHLDDLDVAELHPRDIYFKDGALFLKERDGEES